MMHDHSEIEPLCVCFWGVFRGFVFVWVFLFVLLVCCSVGFFGCFFFFGGGVC